MKEVFLKRSMSLITSYKSDLSEEDNDKLLYGLEGLYMTMTKLIIIFIIAFLLGFVREFIISLILFNIIRFPGFGFHANKSIECLISSTILILGLPYLFVNIKFSFLFKIILCVISVIVFAICAPADTKKRPLTNKRKRFIRKMCACSLAVLYSVMIIIFSNHMISDLLLGALMIETILISPILYLIFNEPYRNYKKI